MSSKLDIKIKGYKVEFVKSSKTYIIPGTSFNKWDKLLEQTKVLKTKYDLSENKIPYWIKGFTTFGDLLDSYASQNRKFRRQLAKDIKKSMKEILRKSENNRFQNKSREKMLDNLRYGIARRYNLASSNLAPMGFYDCLFLAMLDRGNVLEYSKLNILNDFMKVNNVDSYTKKEVTELYKNFKEEYGDKTPKEIIDKLESFKEDETTKKYTLHDLLGDDGFQSLRDEVIPYSIQVGDKVVCITEMKNFNGKSNPWIGPHYLFQYLNTYNNYDCDILFEQLNTKETKNSLTGEVLITHDGLQNLKTHFGDSFKKCPEIVPACAIIHRAFQKDINNFNVETDIFEEDEENQKNAFIELYRSMGRVSDKRTIEEMYKSKFNRQSDYKGTESEDVKIINALNTHIENQSLKDAISKFNELNKAIELVRKDDTHFKFDEAQKINNSLVKKLLQKDSIRTLVSSTLAALGTKFGVEKGSESNVDDFLSMFYEDLCGDKVFTIEKDAKGNPIGYKITCNEFLSSILQSGKSNDWTGKGTILYDSFIKTYRTYQEVIGLDDGDNVELKKKEINFLMTATESKDCYWYESDTQGEVGKRGVENGKKLPLTSIQHGDDTTNEWEKIYFEDTSINKGKVRSKKPATKGDGYRHHLSNQEMLLKSGYITKKQYKRARNNLEDLIEHCENVLEEETMEMV